MRCSKRCNNCKNYSSNLVLEDVELPEIIFNRPFDSYLFFDADLSSSDALISALREIVVVCFDMDVEAEVISSATRSFIVHLGKDALWQRDICRIGKTSRDRGEVGGLTLLDSRKRWVAYQSRPVDVGVFAFDCRQKLGAMQVAKDSFFDCVDVSRWLLQSTASDADLVKSMGEVFLRTLVKSYS